MISTGYGVFAEKSFLKGDFLLCYRVDLLDGSDGDEREIDYKKKNLGSFVFYFEHVVDRKSKRLW